MNRFACAGLALLLIIGQAAYAADAYPVDEWDDETVVVVEDFSEVDYYNQLQEQPTVVEPPTVYYVDPTDDGDYEIVQLEDEVEEPEPITYPEDAGNVFSPVQIPDPTVIIIQKVPEYEEVVDDDADGIAVIDDDDDDVEVVEEIIEEEFEPDDDAEIIVEEEVVLVDEPEEVIIEEEEIVPSEMEVVRSYVVDDYPGETPVHSFTATGQYIYSTNKKANVKYGSQRQEMARGHASGSAFSLLYNRQVNDYLKVGIMYQYAFMNLSTGTPVPRGSNAYNRESSRWYSHAFGVIPQFDLGKYGRFQFSVIQSFDKARGYEQTGATRMDIDDYHRDVTSLDAWYEKDLLAGCNWKFTPYVGWRSQYIDFRDKNNFVTGSKYNDYTWTHLGAAGFKVAYQQGAFGFKLRGGVSHRFSQNDVHGYGTRAVAPGVYQYSHNANLDKTVGTAGASINYAINERAGVEFGYDGYMGKDTRAHTGSVSFSLSF